MFEVKKYQWFLSELSKIKSKLKILEISFIKSDQVDSSFFTNNEGTITSASLKTQSIREILERYLNRRMNGLENSETIKPVVYMMFASHKKIAFINDVKDLIRKDQKLHNLKELILFQESQHDYSIFYTLELYYDGEGLESTLYRRETSNPETSIKDNKFLHMTLNLSKYLVSSIESFVEKNVMRLKYDFIVDQNFCPVILYISQIKLVHPKIIALNKGMNADGLENLTLVKNDYKGLTYPKIPTVVKEPDPETISPAPVKKAVYTSIFMSFISKFLTTDQKSRKRQSNKPTPLLTSEQVTPIPLSLTETNERKINSSKSPNPVLLEASKSSFSFSLASTLKLPDIKLAKSSRNLNNKNSYLFTGLKPNNTLSAFLKIEEERILENKNKRATNSEVMKETLPTIEGKKKKRKRNQSKKVKKIKKVRSLPRIISPYQLIQTLK